MPGGLRRASTTRLWTSSQNRAGSGQTSHPGRLHPHPVYRRSEAGTVQLGEGWRVVGIVRDSFGPYFCVCNTKSGARRPGVAVSRALPSHLRPSSLGTPRLALLRRLCASTGPALACVALATSLHLFPASVSPSLRGKEGSVLSAIFQYSSRIHFLCTASSLELLIPSIRNKTLRRSVLGPRIFPKLCAPVVQPNPLCGSFGIPGTLGSRRNLSPSLLTISVYRTTKDKGFREAQSTSP